MGEAPRAKAAAGAGNVQYMCAFGQRQCGNVADRALA